jgi:hypothetical protein
MPADAEVLIRLNQYAQPGKVMDASNNEEIARLVADYKHAADQAKNWEEDKEVCKAKLLEAIGDSEKVILEGWSISAGIQAETPPTLITKEMVGLTYGGRKGYRMLRISQRKPKK